MICPVIVIEKDGGGRSGYAAGRVHRHPDRPFPHPAGAGREGEAVGQPRRRHARQRRRILRARIHCSAARVVRVLAPLRQQPTRTEPLTPRMADARTGDPGVRTL